MLVLSVATIFNLFGFFLVIGYGAFRSALNSENVLICVNENNNYTNKSYDEINQMSYNTGNCFTTLQKTLPPSAAFPALGLIIVTMPQVFLSIRWLWRDSQKNRKLLTYAFLINLFWQ